EFSFDVVSEFNAAELTNALDQARREVGTRYDFKDTATVYDFQENKILIESASEERAKAALQVLREKGARRQLSPKLFKSGDPKVYSEDPADVAAEFVSAGAERIHIVDLDAARGSGDNKGLIQSILRGQDIKIQVAGGIRTAETVDSWLDAGAHAVIMGTIAV